MNANDVIGAVWSPDDGRVSPSDLCAALAKGARSRGAKIFEDTGVTAILTGAGRVVGVETTRGPRSDAMRSRCVRACGAGPPPPWPVPPCQSGRANTSIC